MGCSIYVENVRIWIGSPVWSEQGGWMGNNWAYGHCTDYRLQPVSKLNDLCRFIRETR